VNLELPSLIEVRPANRTQRALGLAAGITGLALIAVSIIAALVTGEDNDTDHDDDTRAALELPPELGSTPLSPEARISVAPPQLAATAIAPSASPNHAVRLMLGAYFRFWEAATARPSRDSNENESLYAPRHDYLLSLVEVTPERTDAEGRLELSVQSAVQAICADTRDV